MLEIFCDGHMSCAPAQGQDTRGRITRLARLEARNPLLCCSLNGSPGGAPALNLMKMQKGLDDMIAATRFKDSRILGSVCFRLSSIMGRVGYGWRTFAFQLLLTRELPGALSMEASSFLKKI